LIEQKRETIKDRGPFRITTKDSLSNFFIRERGMLTVNFHQPSHEFTFNVGIDLISKLTILTLMICQVRMSMWYLEFIVHTGIKHLNEDFRVEFIEYFARRS
jgi:hypothetical protein